MINCFILGEPSTVQTLSVYINQLSLPILGTASTFSEGFNSIISDRPDIVYVEMSFIQKYSEELDILKHKSSFIILSDNPSDALAAFEFKAFDYMVKPIRYSRFVESIDKYNSCAARWSLPTGKRQQDSFFVKTDSKGIKEIMVNYKELVFIEAMQNYVVLHLENGKNHTIYNTLKEMEESLPASLFSRIHKSFIINDDKIAYIEGNTVVMNTEPQRSIVIGNTYRKIFIDKKNKKMIKGHKQKPKDLDIS